MLICACDPDCKKPAFALFDKGKLSEWRILKGTIHLMLPEIKTVAERWKPNLLVIENQYLPDRLASLRFRSISHLIAARAMISAVFLLSGINFELVEPFAWQKALGGSGSGREELKRLSLLKATQIAGWKVENHDLADAICLGHWWICTNGLQRGAR